MTGAAKIFSTSQPLPLLFFRPGHFIMGATLKEVWEMLHVAICKTAGTALSVSMGVIVF